MHKFLYQFILYFQINFTFFFLHNQHLLICFVYSWLIIWFHSRWANLRKAFRKIEWTMLTVVLSTSATKTEKKRKWATDNVINHRSHISLSSLVKSSCMFWNEQLSFFFDYTKNYLNLQTYDNVFNYNKWVISNVLLQNFYFWRKKNTEFLWQIITKQIIHPFHCIDEMPNINISKQKKIIIFNVFILLKRKLVR